MSDRDGKKTSAMARTLERLKSRKRNSQSVSPGAAQSASVPTPSSISPQQSVIMYSFPSEDGSTSTVPLIDLSEVNVQNSQSSTTQSIKVRPLHTLSHNQPQQNREHSQGNHSQIDTASQCNILFRVVLCFMIYICKICHLFLMKFV